MRYKKVEDKQAVGLYFKSPPRLTGVGNGLRISVN